MTHELKKIVKAFQAAKVKKIKTVLATVVALEGSSYRRPGVRMLIREDGNMVGAVSGGCVEKEVFLQSQSVFATGIPKMMTYDGRYRLGCEGILYILIEPFAPNGEFLESFEEIVRNRQSFHVISYFSKKEGTNEAFGSVFRFGKKEVFIRVPFKKNAALAVFEQTMQPCFKLIIIGAEHDAVQLCLFASLTGWEVTIVASASEEKNIKDFPGAEKFKSVEPEMFAVYGIDDQTAILLMTHSYVRDLKYLLAIKDANPAYLGLLGPSRRREKLLDDFIERHPEISDAFFDRIHGPAGLNIGAETPQEITIAILAEILSVLRGQKPMKLKNKSGTIHS